MDTSMTETVAVLRLMSWLSPVFPTGGFAYSSGLEQAVATGMVDDAASLENWLTDLLHHGSIRNDGILFAAAHRGSTDGEKIAELRDLAISLSASAERFRETTDQGTAFVDAVGNWFGDNVGPLVSGTPLPVAVGAACGRSDIALTEALACYLHAFVQNQLQCAIRLSVTGQKGAARILAKLEPVVARTASQAAQSTLNNLGSCAVISETTAMNHETLQPRLFLS